MGGPVAVRRLCMLLARTDAPGEGSLEMMPGLFAVIEANAVNRIIDANPADARYLLGMVVWRAGELRRRRRLLRARRALAGAGAVRGRYSFALTGVAFSFAGSVASSSAAAHW